MSRDVLNTGDHARNTRANALAFALEILDLAGEWQQTHTPERTVALALSMARQLQSYIETGEVTP